METLNGVILKGIGGFYYVKTAKGIYECKARGVFRKLNLKPLIGDRVKISVESQGYASIEEIFPRKNELIRPPISNIDQLLVVVSACDPEPDLLVTDKLISIATDRKIEPILVISKVDLKEPYEIEKIYKKIGVNVILFSKFRENYINEIRSVLKGKTTALAGNSGVGKSTILNMLGEDFEMETGKVSKKLGRGKHTTRHVELHPLSFGGFVADTPGFSNLDIGKYKLIEKENLQYCFKEFEPYIKKCKFASCNHTKEKSCAVIEALQNGQISESRYKNYIFMLDELRKSEMLKYK